MRLRIENLQANIDDKEILKGLDITIKAGEVHAIMGPNGSGKSTLANVIAGNPVYKVTGGSIQFGDKNLLEMPVHERALEGIFMLFQYPVEISGVTLGKFLIRAKQQFLGKEKLKLTPFIKEVKTLMKELDLPEEFLNRYLNEGFSGGEKKRAEMLQMMVLRPKLAILDETDSGLDIDALKLVAKGVNTLKSPDFSALIITHYQRILTHVNPDFVHILYRGRIIESGGQELVQKLENEGYDWIKAKYGFEDDFAPEGQPVLAAAV